MILGSTGGGIVLWSRREDRVAILDLRQWRKIFEALPHAFWYHFQLPETKEALQLMAKFFEEKVGVGKPHQ